MTHEYKPGRFSDRCTVQLARYPCPYPRQHAIHGWAPTLPPPAQCTCDPGDLFDPPDPTPRAVEGCSAHRARRAAQLFAERLD